MFHDFEFKDDGRMVHCTRGLRNAAAGHATDVAWWYLSLEGTPPVRLLRVYPGETREQVWESALCHLDALQLRSDQTGRMAGLQAAGRGLASGG